MTSVPPATDDVNLPTFVRDCGCLTQARYTLDVKVKALPVCERLYDIEYPLDTFAFRDTSGGCSEGT